MLILLKGGGELSSLKKFSDTCAGFAAFSAFMYVFCQFMAYDFGDSESTIENIKFFLLEYTEKNYSFYISLIALFMFSCAFSVALNRFPHVTLCVSVLPLAFSVAMLVGKNLYERPMLYVILAAVHVFGCFYECIRRDREDGKARASLACDLLALVIVIFSVYIIILSRFNAEANEFRFDLLMLLPSEKFDLFKAFLAGKEGIDLEVFIFSIIFFSALPIIRQIVGRLYFIDAALSLIPLIYLAVEWNSGFIPLFGEVLVVLAFTYSAARFAIMMFCRAEMPIEENKKGNKIL